MIGVMNDGGGASRPTCRPGQGYALASDPVSKALRHTAAAHVDLCITVVNRMRRISPLAPWAAYIPGQDCSDHYEENECQGNGEQYQPSGNGGSRFTHGTRPSLHARLVSGHFVFREQLTLVGMVGSPREWT